MKKNDKLIVVLGVIVLVVASLGIYYIGEEPTAGEADLEDIFKVTGQIQNMPAAIKIPDSNQFYPLVATPLAVHYDENCEQEAIPLYVENFENPSNAVERLQKEQLDKYKVTTWQDMGSGKNLSIKVAKDYWKSSEAVLIIEESQEGYNLGVAATPIASYLSIPVIVTDEIDEDVEKVLEDLGVEMSLVCGDINGYKESFELDDIHEILDASIQLVRQKFSDVDYITLANPRDAYPPKVLNTTKESFSGKLQPMNVMAGSISTILTAKAYPFEFSIPEDYKYARVTIEIVNQESAEDIEKFGDNVMVTGGPSGYLQSSGCYPILDDHGELKNDRIFFENTYYDCGGEEFSLSPKANIMTKQIPEYEATVTIEKLEHAYDPLIEKVSSMAPYLTAYRKGIIFADPDFAFVNDEAAKLHGENLPGATTVHKNPEIIPLLNNHVYNKIHKPLNDLLAELRDIDAKGTVEYLTEDYSKDPVYIALLGDANMLPQYFYRNPHSDPYETLDKSYGTNTPSDFIYGNIDPLEPSPVPYKEDFLEDDQYSEFPEMENIVGRITGGFDVQDTSAMIARTAFYDDVIESLSEDWKNNALVMSGAGLEFQGLPILDLLYRIAGSPYPMKWPTGQQHFLSLRTADYLTDNGEFDVERLERGQAQSVGFSKEALKEIKQDRLLFPKAWIQFLQGFENVKSLTDKDWWSTALDDGAGIHGAESQMNSNFIQSNAHGIYFDYSPGDVQMYASGGGLNTAQFISRIMSNFPGIPALRSGLENHGGYAVRDVSLWEMGPSVMWVECCGGGKIDSLHPYNTLTGAYTHAGVNSFICPTTYSAISGYLEPKDSRVGLGLKQWSYWNKQVKQDNYPGTEFCGWMFEKSYEELFENDCTIGEALHAARNEFLEDQFDAEYLWTPPLEYGNGVYEKPAYIKSTASGGGSNVPIEKYAAIFELNLIGDPMFNPYEPVNEGS